MEKGRKSARFSAHVASPAAALAMTVSGLFGCGSAAGAPAAASPVPSAATAARSPAPTTAADEPAAPTAAADEPAALPAPGEPIPNNASRLAKSLRQTTGELHHAIDAWVAGRETVRSRPPEPVVLLALHQQRIYRFTARHPEVAARAFARLPAALAGEARDNTRAIRGLLALARPIKGSVPFKVASPLPAGALLGYFKAAERKFGVEWEVLASVMFAESKFGRVKSASWAGAQGPMQFMPATWKAYGMGGDIHDPRDAVMAAANYLRASGAPRDYERALNAYNHSRAYVDAVLAHARQMKRDPRNYYAYYNWQVFVLTTDGERRLTGPSASGP